MPSRRPARLPRPLASHSANVWPRARTTSLTRTPTTGACVVNALGKSVHAAHARRQLPHPLLLQLRGLVEKDHVVLRALIAIRVPVAGAVSELQYAPVPEHEPSLLRPVYGRPRQLQPQRLQMICLDLRHGPPHQQHPYPRIPLRQQLGLAPHRPALSAAPRPAEGDILLLAPQEFLLPLIGCPDIDLHSLPLFSPKTALTRTPPQGTPPSMSRP